MLLQNSQIVHVSQAVWQVDVLRGWLLHKLIVMQLMNGKCEDVVISAKNCRGAVTVMHISIHHHRSFDRAVELQAPDGDGHIMNHTKTFPMIGTCVVEPSANIRGPAIAKRALSGKNRAARREPTGFD